MIDHRKVSGGGSRPWFTKLLNTQYQKFGSRYKSMDLVFIPTNRIGPPLSRDLKNIFLL